jgi:hypothetical protein
LPLDRLSLPERIYAWELTQKDNTVKRNLDLMVRILAKGEELPPGPSYNIDIDGHTPEEISYHIKLLHEEGLIEALSVSHLQAACCWQFRCLTNRGHEFLDAARSNTSSQKVTIGFKGQPE